MTGAMSASVQGYAWFAAFIVLGVLYIYVHYAFATASGHVAALYAPFAAVAIAAGAPPMMVAICFGIFSNLMGATPSTAAAPARSTSPQATSSGPASTRSTSSS